MCLKNIFEQFKLLSPSAQAAVIVLMGVTVVLLVAFPSASTSIIGFLLALKTLASK